SRHVVIVIDHCVGAAPREFQHDFAPDPSARAGHQRNFAIQNSGRHCGYCIRMRSPVLLAIAAASTLLAQSWIPQQSNSTASLRGVHAVSARIVWASGTRGTVLKTTDGGATWQAVPVTGAADLDFRAIHAFDERTALAMSAGPGEKSRIYKTTDGGATWRIAQPNLDPKGFWDAMAFWDESHGIVLGDPVDGRFTILT